MTKIAKDALERLLHLADVPEACPYLEGRVATFRFGNGYLAGSHYRELLDGGYRRNGIYLYRPVCRRCNECKVLRIPVRTMRKTKEQRRIWNRGNRMFSVECATPSYTEEKGEVYRRYLCFQHGAHAQANDRESYRRFLVETCLGQGTFEIQYRAGSDLVGVGLVDCLDDALSTVYFYFNPDYARYSPGTYSVLKEVSLAEEWGLRYYYLGYYIRDSRTMSYKVRFRPYEVKDTDSDTWLRIE